MKRFVFLALSSVLTGCSTLPSAEEYRRELHARLRAVVVEDGINEQESQIIADAYLDEHMSVSFSHVGPYDGGAIWIFKIAGDIAPIELPDIPPVRVDKTTGAVTWEAKAPLKK